MIEQILSIVKKAWNRSERIEATNEVMDELPEAYKDSPSEPWPEGGTFYDEIIELRRKQIEELGLDPDSEWDDPTT